MDTDKKIKLRRESDATYYLRLSIFICVHLRFHMQFLMKDRAGVRFLRMKKTSRKRRHLLSAFIHFYLRPSAVSYAVSNEGSCRGTIFENEKNVAKATPLTICVYPFLSASICGSKPSNATFSSGINAKKNLAKIDQVYRESLDLFRNPICLLKLPLLASSP